MAASVTLPGQVPASKRVAKAATGESGVVRWILIGTALIFLGVFIFLPLGIVFSQAFAKGVGTYWDSLRQPDALAAIRLTLLAAGIAVPLNLVFGVAAAWAIGKFRFKGRSLLITLIDLPLSVSPVVSGLIYVLLFGLQGLLGPWLIRHDLQVIFAVPGIVLATIFVTFPFIARELIPLSRPKARKRKRRHWRWAPAAGNLLPREPAQHQVGPAVWRDPMQCSSHGRVRRGVGGLRTYSWAHQHHAPAHRNSLQRIPIRGCVCRGIFVGNVGSDHSGRQVNRRVERPPTIGAFRAANRGRAIRMSIKAQNIVKNFGHFHALDNVNLEIPSGELVALLGPSGSGKTTLLRIIAGLEFADSGVVLFDDQDITDRTARDRRVGFVFQHYALFRHMTVFENIAFGLKVRPRKFRPSKEQINAKVHELLKLIQLKNLANRYPHSSLEGNASGWRWRVPWRLSLACCCWMSRSARWTRKSGWNCADGYASCMMKFTSPAFLSPTTRMKRSKFQTA